MDGNELQSIIETVLPGGQTLCDWSWDEDKAELSFKWNNWKMLVRTKPRIDVVRDHETSTWSTCLERCIVRLIEYEIRWRRVFGSAKSPPTTDAEPVKTQQKRRVPAIFDKIDYLRSLGFRHIRDRDCWAHTEMRVVISLEYLDTHSLEDIKGVLAARAQKQAQDVLFLFTHTPREAAKAALEEGIFGAPEKDSQTDRLRENLRYLKLVGFYSVFELDVFWHPERKMFFSLEYLLDHDLETIRGDVEGRWPVGEGDEVLYCFNHQPHSWVKEEIEAHVKKTHHGHREAKP